jgi:long-chain acyl-CoA synthetase
MKKWLYAPPHALKAFYANNLSKWNGWERLKSLAVPTLVIRGHRDIVFERPLFEKVAGSIVGAEEADIGVSGHMVMLERREAVNRSMERFVSGEGQGSWREASRNSQTKKSGRDALRKERPWLENYEQGVPYTVGVPNIPLHHLLRSSVRRFPNRPAIFFEGARLSYRKLNREVNRFANALLSLGVGKGARVVLLLPNVPQMVIGFYGVMKAGATAVFVPPVIEPEEIVRQIKDSEAGVLVTLAMWAGLAKQIQEGSGVPHVVLTNPADYLSLPKYLISSWRNRGFGLQNALRWKNWL